MSGQSILLINIAGIGDFLESAAAIAAVRARFPDAHITALVSEKAAAYAGRCPWVTEVVGFPTEKGMAAWSGAFKRLSQVVSLLWQLRRRRFEYAVNFKEIETSMGGFKLALMLAAINPQRSIGRNTRGRGWFFSDRIDEPQTEGHNQHWYFNCLAERLTGVPVLQKPRLWHDEAAGARVNALLAKGGIVQGMRYVVVNPGSDRLTRRWRAQHFAAVADDSVTRHGFKIVVTGNAAEIDEAGAILTCMKTSGFSLAGMLLLDELIVLITGAALVITTNSAVMHIAGIQRVPCVAVGASGNPALDMPSGDPARIRFLWKPRACVPCYRYRCAQPAANACMDAITPHDAINAIEEIVA